MVLPKYVWPVVTLLFAINYFLPFSQDGKVLLLMVLGLLLSLWICTLARYRQRPDYLNLLILYLALGLCVYKGGYFAEQGFVWVVLLLMLPLLYQLIRQWVNDQRKAELALQLENQLLHKSLQPHFLMNCLTLVNELQRENAVQAEQFIHALSEEFRLLNQYAGQPLITLAQELHLCRNYVQLMSIRLQQPHQLHVIGESDAVHLPPASLLVLLENAFSHNKYAQAKDFVIELAFTKEKIAINVHLPVGNKRLHQGSGTGMAYLQKSLQYGFEGKAKVASTIKEECWLVCIELPL
jgi:LytS/YehU family sensor histidine kinase